VTIVHEMFGIKLSQLFSPGGSGMMGGAPASVGSVEYDNVSLDDGRVLACVSRGLFLVREGDRRLALLVSAPRPFGSSLTAQVMAADRAQAEVVLAELRRAMRARSVYRGRIISLEDTRDGSVDVRPSRYLCPTRSAERASWISTAVA